MGRFLITTLATMAVAVVACGDSSGGSAFPDPPAEDASTSFPNTPFTPSVTSDGGADSGTSTFACVAKIPSPFNAAWKAPARTVGACKGTEIADYVAACLVDLSDPTKCAAFKTAHPSCVACTEPADNSGPIQWYQQRKIVRANIAGCVALAQNDVTEDGCGFAYATAIQCQRESCEYCYSFDNISISAINGCQQEARVKGVCASRENLVKTKCTGLTDADAATFPCFPTTNAEPPSSFYPRLIAPFCGE